MAYTQQHASSHATLKRKGAAVTFTHASPGAYDATTDTHTSPASTTVAGYAIQDAGNPEQYKALDLIESEAPTLFFTPTTFGSLPALNDTVSWNSVTWFVRSILPIAPDGTAIAARIVVSR